MSVVSIPMPEALLERIDEFADEHGYSGRSEVVFEYCQPAVQQRLTGARHEYDTIPIRQHRSGSAECPDCGLLDYLCRQRPYSVMT